MKFGYFDDQRREYVITTPTTPHSWINYLGSDSFFSIISHQAGGYCFFRDARLRRLLRRRCRGATYEIAVKNRGRGGPPRLRVNGQSTEGVLVAYKPSGTTVVVECEL